jgi:hypothetical protein
MNYSTIKYLLCNRSSGTMTECKDIDALNIFNRSDFKVYDSSILVNMNCVTNCTLSLTDCDAEDNSSVEIESS